MELKGPLPINCNRETIHWRMFEAKKFNSFRYIRFRTDENRKNSQKQYKIPTIYHSIDNPKDSLSHICSIINRYIVKMKIIFIVYLFVF